MVVMRLYFTTCIISLTTDIELEQDQITQKMFKILINLFMFSLDQTDVSTVEYFMERDLHSNVVVAILQYVIYVKKC